MAHAYPALMSAQAIAQDQNMPRKFLEAVLADLRRAGVVRAQRGAEGGYTLSQSPRDVTIGQVLRAVDGPLAGVRGLRPEETQYSGAAENLPNLWVAVRSAVREVGLSPGAFRIGAATAMPAEVARDVADIGARVPVQRLSTD